jgi:hypothetical protein
MNYRSRRCGAGPKACATFVVALVLTGCATMKPRTPSTSSTPPAPPAPPAASALKALVREIDAILAKPALQHGLGVFAKSLATTRRSTR